MTLTTQPRPTWRLTKYFLIFLLAGLLGPVASAHAASDTTGPVLASWSVTPRTLDLKSGPTTVKVTLPLTDATGVSTPVVTLSHVGTDQSRGFGSMTLVSGTTRDGTWER